jgi:hypothetical protein
MVKTHGARLIASLTLILTETGLPAQEEVGTKERKKILIEWAKLETKSYSIEHEKTVPASTAKQIGEALDDALEQYVALFRHRPEEKLKVRFLESQNTYEQAGGTPGAAAFFQPGTGYLVLKQLAFYDLLPTTYHEACHQYLQSYVGKDVAIPLWFNEGLAEYFEEMQVDRGTKKLSYKLIDNRKLRMVQEKILTRATIPWEKLLDAAHEEFHDIDDKHKEGVYYNQSFSIIYFFMQGGGGKPVFQFMNELKKTKSAEAAYAKLFGKGRKNLKATENKWRAYVAGVKIAEKQGASP